MTHQQAADEIRFRLGIQSLRDAGANVLADQLQSHLDDSHECDENGTTDLGICRSCGDHASFCSECGLSNCCSSKPYQPDDYEINEDR